MTIASKLSKYIIPIGILLVLAKLLMVIVYLFLPPYGINDTGRYDYTPEYIRVDIAKLFFAKRSLIHSDTTQEETGEYFDSIDEFILKGLYGNEHGGYAVLAMKQTPQKTVIVSTGESFNGYRLKSIKLNYVVFEKDQKEYKVALQKIEAKTTPGGETAVVPESLGSTFKVYKQDIKYFASNPREIWKNISIYEVKKDGKTDGFKVKWVRKNSKFARLGIKAGDVIIKVNNKRLKSYKDAIDIYSNISKLKEISLVVLRNNEEKEFIYEIN